MNRTDYNSCMRPYITGSKPKEQRKLDFCVGAKMCSGKASSRGEAEQICSQPKAPKAPKATKIAQAAPSKANCKAEAVELSKCVAGFLLGDPIFDDERLRDAIKICSCGKES